MTQEEQRNYAFRQEVRDKLTDLSVSLATVTATMKDIDDSLGGLADEIRSQNGRVRRLEADTARQDANLTTLASEVFAQSGCVDRLEAWKNKASGAIIILSLIVTAGAGYIGFIIG